jgi:hypothetical protein
VIDRAGDWDGDAVPAARNRTVGGERGDAFPADAPPNGAPADGAQTDAVLTAPDERVAADRLYRDKVDHTYDVVRIEAGEDGGSQDTRPRDASEEGAARDADAEQGETGKARETEAPDAADTRPRDADSEPREAEPPEAEAPEAEAPEAEAPEAEETERRDAWAEALPGLREEWEKHEREFPERSRSASGAQADGGWSGDGDRRLTPEQNTDASKACEDIRTEGTEVILPAMERVEAADPGRRLAGLEHMLKGEDRLKEKVSERLRYNPDWAAEQALVEVPDAVRFTLEYGDDRYTEGVRADVDRLKAEGFDLLRLKNLWAKDQYKGINSQWRRSETGVRFEVQFHTPASLEAKELTHKAYERLRNPATSTDEEVRLEDYQRRVNEQVPFPPRVFEIENYPPERRDGR